MNDPVLVIGNFSKFSSCKCGHEIGIVIQSGKHKKLICDKCKSYIKFVSEKEILLMAIPVMLEDNIYKDDFSLEFLHFKIDLILDHLGLRVPSKK